MKLLNILFLVFLISGSTAAQHMKTSFKLEGKIIDAKEKKGLSYITITVYKLPEKQVVKRMASDINGNFKTTLFNEGNYLLSIDMLGFDKFEKEFQLNNSNQSYRFESIELSESTTEIEAVEIIEQKQLVTVEPDKIVYNTDADPDSKTETALDMFKRIPLITVDGDDNIQLKGNTNFKIHLNGRPSNMITKNPKDVLRSLPANSIKKVEVITSPGAKYDAEGVGGIINIITHKKIINGYMGSVNVGAATPGRISGGGSFSAAFGKFIFSLNFGANHSENPNSHSLTERENYLSSDLNFMETISKSMVKSDFSYGSGDLSYEIDSLNLISASFDFWTGEFSSSSNGETNIYNINNQLFQSYTTLNKNTNTFGNPGLNIDYQNTSKHDKNRIFTLSYKANFNPGGQTTDQNINNVLNFYSEKRKTNQDDKSNEHTFQVDYVYPIKKIGKLESGTKYIMRINKSLADRVIYDYDNSVYVDDPSGYINFAHNQDIIAGYLSFGGKIKKFGYKAGVRVESSVTTGTFENDLALNFRNTNLEYVPSCSFSLQSGKMNSFQLSYSKRIQRPGIWYLNPYVNDTDPKNIRYGNPNLDPEHFHSFDLNYNIFMKSGNINLGTFYSFSNNGIDRISWIESEDVIHTSYENILEKKSLGISANINLRFGKKFNMSTNISMNYDDITNVNDETQHNSGWGGFSYMRLQYNILKTLKISIYGGIFNPPVSLQSQRSIFNFSGLSLTKQFLKEKLSVSVSARDIFWKEKVFEFDIVDDTFYQSGKYYRVGRNFGINVSYRFGEMNKRVKKARRGIKNTDLKEKESDNSQSQ